MENEKNNKIAIIADIHANYYCLKKILDDIEKRKIKEIIFLGDYVSDGFENNKVLDTVKKYKYVIMGNRELYINNYDGYSWQDSEQFQNMLYTYHDITKENKEYLKSLSSYKIITLENKKICLSHGTPYNNRECVNCNSFDVFDRLIQDYNCDIYLFAHTHEACFTTYKDKLFINPGSVILPADKPTSKYGILDLDNSMYESIEIPYNFDELRDYYLKSKYFIQNKEWCNLLIHTNEKGIDYICGFIDFVKEKAKKEKIDIRSKIPNDLWNAAFIEFMKEKNLAIYK